MGGLSLVRVDCEDGIGDIFEEIVAECFFSAGMGVHELGEVEDPVFVEEQLLFGGFGVDNPLLLSFEHWNTDGRSIISGISVINTAITAIVLIEHIYSQPVQI